MDLPHSTMSRCCTLLVAHCSSGAILTVDMHVSDSMTSRVRRGSAVPLSGCRMCTSSSIIRALGADKALRDEHDRQTC